MDIQRLQRLQMIQRSLYQEKIPICVVYVVESEKKIYHIVGLDKSPTQETLTELWDGLQQSTDWNSIKDVINELKVDVVKTQDLLEAYSNYNL